MKEEYKELLLKDLCARLPYGVMCRASIPDLKTDTPPEEIVLRLTSGMLSYIWIDCRNLRPYLHPMSSMTEEERKEYNSTKTLSIVDYPTLQSYDWLNAHHFDYRGLISMGIALEAPEGMYNIE